MNKYLSSRIIIVLIGFLCLFIIVGFFERTFKKEQKSSPLEITTTRSAGIFTVDGIKIGDQLAGMTVEEIKSVTGKEISEQNIEVKFSGVAKLNGEYFDAYPYGVYDRDEGSPIICFHNLDVLSQTRIPWLKGYNNGKIEFCFNNRAFTQNVLGGKGSSGKATVVINNYTFVSYPTEFASPYADLLEVLEKEAK